MRDGGVTKKVVMGGACIASCAGASWLTHQVLAPQMVNLFEAVGMHGAHKIGQGLALMILAASVAAKVSTSVDVSISRAILVITCCVALVRVKVVNDEWDKALAKFQAQRAAYDEAKANKDAAIQDAKDDPDLNAEAPYLHRKREARANLEKARAMILPNIPEAPHSGWDAWLVSVAGPAGLEAASAILTKFLGGKCGELLALFIALIWAPPHRDREEDQKNQTHTPSINLNALSDEARHGLDLNAGTWRGLTLGTPALKGGVLWPTLAHGKRKTFIGTVPARRMAGEKVSTRRRTQRLGKSCHTTRMIHLLA